MPLESVDVTPLQPQRFADVLTGEGFAQFEETIAAAHALLGTRTIWNVNSTAFGGGVAEMLRSLIGYVRGAGLDGRWVVADGDPEFFQITKRLHNRLHGFAGDGGPLGDAERAAYERRCWHQLPVLCVRPRGPRPPLAMLPMEDAGGRPGRRHDGRRPSRTKSTFMGEVARYLVEPRDLRAFGERVSRLLGAIAGRADFFSFGTNDLTQTGLRFPRDDIEGRIMPLYANLGIVELVAVRERSTPGAWASRWRSRWSGRAAKPGLQAGRRVRRAGRPVSTRFSTRPGSTTCPTRPFRARVAAAQAAVAEIRTSGR